MEGAAVFKNVDIYSEAGGGNKAYVKTSTVTVKDGALSIEFIHQIENPKLCALEIHPAVGAGPPLPQPTASPPQPTPPSTLGQPDQQAIFINAGGPSFVDTDGNTWVSDESYHAGKVYTTNSPITNTDKPVLYQTERSKSQMEYSVALLNGSYDVRLHFAEIFSGAFREGARVFDVFMEGELMVGHLDIYKEAGNKGNKAYVVDIGDVAVNDGSLDIDFVRVKQSPKISGIEIRPVAQQAIFINAGGEDFVDSNGNKWVSDESYNVGKKYSTTRPISNTDPDKQVIYQSERFESEMTYNVALLNGSYQVQLHFAEIYDGAFREGARIFDIFIEGDLISEGFDIFKEAGSKGDTAYVMTMPGVAVKDGFLSIDFVGVKQKAKISAIEVHPAVQT
jgi:hypothetical protein